MSYTDDPARTLDPPIAASTRRTRARPFTICATLFLCAAVVVAALNFSTPFTRGWWLVAYLSLVGGIAQLLLGPGLLAIAWPTSTEAPRATVPSMSTQLVLWNTGTVIVAVASMARIPIGVPAGSLLLFAALALFTTRQRAVREAAGEAMLGRHRAYTALRWFLALSVIVGNLLAYRGYR